MSRARVEVGVYSIERGLLEAATEAPTSGFGRFTKAVCLFLPFSARSRLERGLLGVGTESCPATPVAGTAIDAVLYVSVTCWMCLATRQMGCVLDPSLVQL